MLIHCKENGSGSDEDYVAENSKREQQQKQSNKVKSFINIFYWFYLINLYAKHFYWFYLQFKVKISQAPVDEEEVDMPSLKDRLAAFNINDSSPPDHSGNDKVHFIHLLYLNDRKENSWF